MIKHDQFRRAGKVSVWIGNLASDIELDDYMNVQRAFEKDFGFEINERDMPETKVADGLVPIPKLIEGFSWSASYAQSVNKIDQENGIDKATTMIIFINFEYNPDLAKPSPSAPVMFLGVGIFSA